MSVILRILAVFILYANLSRKRTNSLIGYVISKDRENFFENKKFRFVDNIFHYYSKFQKNALTQA